MKTQMMIASLVTLTTLNSLSQAPGPNLFPTSGNVGIGTGTPLTKLQILDPTSAFVQIYTTGYNPAKVSVANSYLEHYFSTAGGIGHLGTTLQTAGGPVDYPLINFGQYVSNPQVWIGNLKPQGSNVDFSLGVQGKIVAQSVYVTATGSSNWADYVFAKNYKLPKLTEVEKFYKANKHLPEIPSASEIAKKGIDLGEMNTVLVKKIEELTLYIVELNKKVEALELGNRKLMNK